MNVHTNELSYDIFSSFFRCLSHSFCSFKNFSFFATYPSYSFVFSQTSLNIRDASNFSPAPSCLLLFSNSLPVSLSYFRPPAWFAYRFARVIPLLFVKIENHPGEEEMFHGIKSPAGSGPRAHSCARDLPSVGTSDTCPCPQSPPSYHNL